MCKHVRVRNRFADHKDFVTAERGFDRAAIEEPHHRALHDGERGAYDTRAGQAYDTRKERAHNVQARDLCA